MKKIAVYVSSFLIIMLAIGCGSGGGGKKDRPGGGAPATAEFISFSPDINVSNPPPDSVYMDKDPRTDETFLYVNVMINNLSGFSDVMGAAFELQFAPEVVTFTGFEEGDFMPASTTYTAAFEVDDEGVPLHSKDNQGNPEYKKDLDGNWMAGVLLVGIARTPENSSPANSSGKLVTLIFKKVAAGSNKLEIKDNAIEISNSSGELETLQPVNWSSGEVTVP